MNLSSTFSLAFSPAVPINPTRSATPLCPLNNSSLRQAWKLPNVTIAPATKSVRMVLSKEQSTASSSSPSIPLQIMGNNISVTESLRLYISDKLSKVTSRYTSILTKIDVHLVVEQNPSIHNRNKVEVVAFAGKTILRTEVRSDDMYGSIDAVQERIVRTIRKYKERKEAKYHQSNKAGKNAPVSVPGVGSGPAFVEDQEEDEMYKDIYERKEVVPGIPAVNEIVKRKVFPMPLQTVEEAVLCCEYVDHPWYLFRNAESKEIGLVYKRNHGGYGLIEPSNPESNDEEQVI